MDLERWLNNYVSKVHSVGKGCVMAAAHRKRVSVLRRLRAHALKEDGDPAANPWGYVCA